MFWPLWLGDYWLFSSALLPFSECHLHQLRPSLGSDLKGGSQSRRNTLRHAVFSVMTLLKYILLSTTWRIFSLFILHSSILGRYAQPRGINLEDDVGSSYWFWSVAAVHYASCPLHFFHLTLTEGTFCSGLLFGIPSSPPGTYLTLSLRNLGWVFFRLATTQLIEFDDSFNTITTNLLSIPSKAGHMVMMLTITIISEQLNDRSFVSMAEDLWILPFLIALRTLPDNPNSWLFYVYFIWFGAGFIISTNSIIWPQQALSSVLLMYPYTHPIQVGWCSRNSGGVASRTVSASVYNMYVPIIYMMFRFTEHPWPASYNYMQVRAGILYHRCEHLSDRWCAVM